MSRANENQYGPDYVSPPGETLSEILGMIGMSQAELADRTGRAKKTINEIVKGKAHITPKIALEFETVLGVSASFWNNRETQFREYSARIEEQERLKKHFRWLDQFPVSKMVKLGWVEGFKDKVQQLREMLKFFQISSPGQWERYVKTYTDQVVFRKSETFKNNIPATIAWLRQGEIQARTAQCRSFDSGRFREALGAIRSLTIEPPETFRSKMVDLAADAGLALVFVPELPSTKISAATRWLSPTKPMIQLSLLYKKNDQFWFSFFHEAAHIILHGKRDFFIQNGDDQPGEKENAANSYAANFLILPAQFRALVKYGKPSKDRVLQFASDLGIAPGIIVGRLQRDKILPWSHYNDLKASFEWADA